MDDKIWTWQRDGAKAHTVRASIQFLQLSTPDFIAPEDWSSKSPGLNVTEFGKLCLELVISRNSETSTRHRLY